MLKFILLQVLLFQRGAVITVTNNNWSNFRIIPFNNNNIDAQPRSVPIKIDRYLFVNVWMMKKSLYYIFISPLDKIYVN